MAREDFKQTREIDGWTYSVEPLAFGEGQKALMRFLRIAAPVFAQLLDAAKGGMEKAGAAALQALPALVSDDDVAYFSRVFGEKTEATQPGNSYYLDPKNRDLHFDRRYAAFFRWLAFCLEVNFSGFFGDLMPSAASGGSVAPGLAAANPSNSSSTSGSSGGS